MSLGGTTALSKYEGPPIVVRQMIHRKILNNVFKYFMILSYWFKTKVIFLKKYKLILIELWIFKPKDDFFLKKP